MRFLVSVVIFACAAWSVKSAALGGCGCAPEIKTISSVCLGAAAVPNHLNWEEQPQHCGCEPALDWGHADHGHECDCAEVQQCPLSPLPPCGTPCDKTYGQPINVSPSGSRVIIPSEPLVVKPVIVARTQSVSANPTIITRPQSPSVQIRPVVLQVLRQIQRPSTQRTLVINRGAGAGLGGGLGGAFGGLGGLAGLGGGLGGGMGGGLGGGCGGPSNPCGHSGCHVC